MSITHDGHPPPARRQSNVSNGPRGQIDGVIFLAFQKTNIDRGLGGVVIKMDNIKSMLAHDRLQLSSRMGRFTVGLPEKAN